MKKYIFYILTFVFILSACSNKLDTNNAKHTNNVTPILYYEKGPSPFGREASTAILKSGILEDHEDYIRGFSHAIPSNVIDIADNKYSLSPDEWQIFDYTFYKDNEIFIANNHRSSNSEICIINNGSKYFFPMYEKGYSDWQMNNNNFYVFIAQQYENDWGIIIQNYNLLSGEYVVDKIPSYNSENMEEKPSLQENFYIYDNNLYFTEYLANQEKLILSKYEFETKTFEHFVPDGFIADYFFFKDEILLISASSEYDLVIDRLDYNFTLKDTSVSTPPNNYKFLRFASNDKIAILDGVLYGTMGRDDGTNAFFGYDIINKKWTDVCDVSKPDENLMDIRLTYEDNNGNLIELQPHINNTK